MMNLLLRRSGYFLRSSDEKQLNVEAEAMILAVVKHDMTFDDVVRWFKERIAPID